MSEREKRVAKALRIVFGCMLFTVIFLFLAGEIFLPKEDPTESGQCTLLEDGWERVWEDGTRERIEVPGQCEADNGKVVRIERNLPQEQTSAWLCMRASQQDMRIYIGDELRKEYSTESTRVVGANSASAFVFCEVREEDAGRVLAIELVSHSEYAGLLNEVYIGDRFDIINLLIKECSMVLLVSFCLFIVSVVAIIIGCILRWVYQKKVDLIYLSLGVLEISLAMIAESRVRQFFLPNLSIASHVGFLLTMLIPYPFMVYVSRIQKMRYDKYYRPLAIITAIHVVVLTLLQVLGIVDFINSMGVSYAIIVIVVVVIAVTIIVDICKGRMADYGEVLFGFIVMMVVALWETYITFVPIVPFHGGVALSIGLMILLFMAGCKTAREMLKMEKEKQRAIVASEAKANFLANMSHEIRTPINTIIGMNEMILRENDDEVIKGYSQNVQNASQLLLGLINDILDFSKIEAGKLSIVEEQYQLPQMLADVIQGIRFKAESKNLIMITDVDEMLPSVLYGDELRIRQILNNLLSNAVKYTSEGMITLVVKGVRDENGFALVVSVTDTGIGIREGDLDKVFDSFQRLEENRNRFIQGTGLGLNITKQLVEMMGGKIGVVSEHGKGSRFEVVIPQVVVSEDVIGDLSDAHIPDGEEAEEKRLIMYAPEARILVVDDNVMNLSVVKALLKRSAIQLELANGGNECLMLCRQQEYDLILMDHMMPEPDGIETLHMLRKDKETKNADTPVVVLTANAIAGAAEQYIAEGFADYLAKPIISATLEMMIEKYLPEHKVSKVEKIVQKAAVSESTEADVIVRETSEDKLYIDKKRGMIYCDGEEEFYREMVQLYYEQGQSYTTKLWQYYEQKDWKNLQIILHAIKSTSMTIGAQYMLQKAKELEAAVKNGNAQDLSAEYEIFFGDYQKMLDKLEKEYNLNS